MGRVSALKLQTVVVVLRHNTRLAGDKRLAGREFDALVGAGGRTVTDRAAFGALFGGAWFVPPVELSPDGVMVAKVYRDLAADAVLRLLQRSAFAQEVLILDEREAARSAFIAACSSPCHLTTDCAGNHLVVALAHGYVIESESVLDGSIMSGRIAATIALLLEPFVRGRASSRSDHLRRAKKTTLSLSHDLHIYKAKFFPRMARALLNIFGKDGAVVLDPYCGSGTALLEASSLGLDSYGCDIDPICRLISGTKVTPFLNAGRLIAVLQRFEKRLQEQAAASDGFQEFPLELRAKINRKDRKNGTNHLSEILDETAKLAASLDGLHPDRPEEELLFTLASDALTKKIRHRFVGVGNGRYAIDVTRRSLLDRLREKLVRSRQLAGVFHELTTRLNIRFGAVKVSLGNAEDRATWPAPENLDVVLTSPPYLPASSGREHYAAARALSFAVVGPRLGANGVLDRAAGDAEASLELFFKYPEAARLMAYLTSDAALGANPHRDAMRCRRKAGPTLHYLSGVRRFFTSVHDGLAPDGVLLLVVAARHIFYSHRRMACEHVVSGRDLYAELAADAGLDLVEAIPLELEKAAVTCARPMAREAYAESVLVFTRRRR